MLMLKKKGLIIFFEKKQVGRPRGSFEEKQSQYLKMLNA